MPPYKQIKCLQNLSLIKFSALVSRSIAYLVNGRYAHKKQTIAAKIEKQSRKRTAKKLQITVVIPIKEVQRIKTFLRENIPKRLRNEIFITVLNQVTKILLKEDTALGGVSEAYRHSLTPPEKLALLDEGIMYVHNVLMCKEITIVDFTLALHLAMKWVDVCRLSNMNPKQTALDYSQIETIFLKHFAENAKTMSNLVSLTWPHLISGDLIRIITGNFQNLRELILACSCETGPYIEVERKGCGKIGSQEDLIVSLKTLFKRCPGDFTGRSTCGCPRLRRLILPNLDEEENKAAEILADAIIALKDLEVISGISTLLSLVVLKNKNIRGLSLPLKTLNDYDPFKKRKILQVDFLPGLLPKLESIELRVSEDLTKRIIGIFTKVKELSIEYPKFHTMTKNYTDLIYLNISFNFQCPWHLLVNLSKHCKGLKYLTLEQSTFKVDSQSLQCRYFPWMPYLRVFKLIRSSFIEFVALLEFVKGCSKLDELYITLSNDRNYSVDEFGDDLVMAIAPHLKNLEKFTAECLYKFNLYLHLNCTLTIATAYTLINYCPKLRFIGHLDSWNVKDKDIEALSIKIKCKNWDLDIV